MNDDNHVFYIQGPSYDDGSSEPSAYSRSESPMDSEQDDEDEDEGHEGYRVGGYHPVQVLAAVLAIVLIVVLP